MISTRCLQRGLIRQSFMQPQTRQHGLFVYTPSLNDDYLSTPYALPLIVCTALFTNKMAARLAHKRQRYVFGAFVSVDYESVTVFRFQYDPANHNSRSVGFHGSN
jgi:hypothetical protein